MNPNIILQTDSYKIGGHWNMLPPSTQRVYSYFEARTGATYPETVFFGLQYLLQKYLVGEQVTLAKLDEATELCAAHFGADTFFNRDGWLRLLEKHQGRLPLRIKAAPEGMPIAVGNVMMTMENTDPEFPWLTNYVETLLTHVWYPSTVATRSREIKKVLKSALEKSSDSLASLPFMLHDFGYRGVSSDESAALGGAAHLVNFLGTDTLAGIRLLRDYYNGKLPEIGFSVAASEHSIATAEGESGEAAYLDRLLERYPSGILSVVADSYDIENFVKVYVRERKEAIIKRWSNGQAPLNRLVIRPDSPRYVGELPANQVVWLMERLWEIFGGIENGKGCRVLHPAVGVIYGDGLSEDEIAEIYRWLPQHRFDVSSVVVGMGGGLLQKVNRDTQRFAYKCSAQQRNGAWIPVQKRPLDKSKSSKQGRLTLAYDGESFATVEPPTDNDMLATVFEDGELRRFQPLSEVREWAAL